MKLQFVHHRISKTGKKRLPKYKTHQNILVNYRTIYRLVYQIGRVPLRVYLQQPWNLSQYHNVHHWSSGPISLFPALSTFCLFFSLDGLRFGVAGLGVCDVGGDAGGGLIGCYAAVSVSRSICFEDVSIYGRM